MQILVDVGDAQTATVDEAGELISGCDEVGEAGVAMGDYQLLLFRSAREKLIKEFSRLPALPLLVEIALVNKAGLHPRFCRSNAGGQPSVERASRRIEPVQPAKGFRENGDAFGVRQPAGGKVHALGRLQQQPGLSCMIVMAENSRARHILGCEPVQARRLAGQLGERP